MSARAWLVIAACALAWAGALDWVRAPVGALLALAAAAYALRLGRAAAEEGEL